MDEKFDSGIGSWEEVLREKLELEFGFLVLGLEF